MRVIFLDIDGVLVTKDSLRKGGKSGTQASFDPACVASLCWLLEQTGAKIVVSSTWRWAGIDFLRERLASDGVAAEIIDVTPTLHREIGKLTISATRGQEIGAWLLQHPEVKQLVILDDDDSMGHLKRWHVHTSWEGGLTPALALEAKNRMEIPKPELWGQ